MIFYSISRQLLQPHSEKGKTCYPHLTKGETETEHKNDCPVLPKKNCPVGVGIALDSLLFSVLVRLLCVTAGMLSYNDEIFQLRLEWLEFLLTPLSSCSILCSCPYLPRFYFLLIVMKFWKEASSSGRSIQVAARWKMTLRLSGIKSVCVGTDVWMHQTLLPQHSSSNSFYFPTNQSFLTIVQGFPIVAILNKAVILDLCNERRGH